MFPKLRPPSRLTLVTIEKRAVNLLARHCGECLRVPRLTPIVEIARAECERLGATLKLNVDLGLDRDGRRLLGSCRVHAPYAIDIGSTVDLTSLPFNFTLAHELAHLELHRDLDLTDIDDDPHSIRDDKRHLFQGRYKAPGSERAWLEWQANNFAAALLMPATTFDKGLVDHQIASGARRPGHLYIDSQPDNQRAYWAAVAHLSGLFLVSKTAVRYRLQRLKLVSGDIQEPPQPTIHPNHFEAAIEKLRQEVP